MKHVHRLFALLLAVTTALSALAPSAAASYYAESSHPDVSYEDMARTGIDTDAADALLRRFAADPAAYYQELLDLVDELVTQESLAEIQSSRNAGDYELSETLEQVQDDYARVMDKVCLAISRTLDSPRGDALRALMPEGEADGFTGYEAASDAELDAISQESSLVQDYYLLPDDDFEDAAAEIYLQLIGLRRQEAERAGYDSYAAYAYDVLYSRDYVPEDAQRLHQVVKEYIAPLYLDVEYALYGRKPCWDPDDVPDDAEILRELRAHIAHVSPELEEALDYMLRNRLYCVGSGDELLDMGYTTTLPSYRSAFLFNKVSSRMEAFKSTVHEFGHFNAAYHDATPSLYSYSNMDVSEIQSQGLEMLFIPCLQDILAGDDPEQRSLVALYALSGMLSAVVDGCLYDEFEQAAYSAPDMTVQDLHGLEAKLNEEYGLDELYEPGIFWTYIGHLFEQPFYYVSYAASALPALDIWLTSLEDRNAAVDAYMKVSAAGTDEWFLDVLEDCGLCDVTSRRDVVRLAAAAQTQADALMQSLPPAAPGASFLPSAALGVAAVVAVILVIVLRRRKARDEAEAFL